MIQFVTTQRNLARDQDRGAACVPVVLRSAAADEAEKKRRNWLEDMHAKDAAARKLVEQADAAAQVATAASEAAAAAAATPERTKTKTVDGGHVWVREERLTLRVGPLQRPWEKKIDPKTGRTYFRNHDTRQTTWVDPRSASVRKKDAAETKGDELPFGWDEAEINGETYYIDHNTHTTSWIHPRLLLEERREEYVRREATVAARAQAHRDTIREFREKRRRLDEQRLECGDSAAEQAIDQRIAHMDAVLARELAGLRDLLGENAALKDDIVALHNQFRKKAYEAEHGEGTFDENDVTDLYNAAKKAPQQLPSKLDTMVGTRLKARRSIMHEKGQLPPALASFAEDDAAAGDEPY